ncbi:MAG: TRAP transporter TatT component family protein [Actinomycetota bacterium]
MKHKKIFQKVRKLIDERELVAENLDTVYGELTELVEQDPECGWAYGLLSEIYFWFGEAAEAENKLFCFSEGVKYGEKGIGADENSLESNVWLAVNYGSYGQEKGVMKSLSLISPIKKLAERAARIDEGYFYGGPWRILGRLYHKAPGFPLSIGNHKKALECLEKALKFGPRFFLNRLFLAEAYLSNGEKAKAKEHLEWILEAEPNKNHEREDEGCKREAESLLKNL